MDVFLTDLPVQLHVIQQNQLFIQARLERIEALLCRSETE